LAAEVFKFVEACHEPSREEKADLCFELGRAFSLVGQASSALNDLEAAQQLQERSLKSMVLAREYLAWI
jgi:hypothetical protein